MHLLLDDRSLSEVSKGAGYPIHNVGCLAAYLTSSQLLIGEGRRSQYRDVYEGFRNVFENCLFVVYNYWLVIHHLARVDLCSKSTQHNRERRHPR